MPLERYSSGINSGLRRCLKGRDVTHLEGVPYTAFVRYLAHSLTHSLTHSIQQEWNPLTMISHKTKNSWISIQDKSVLMELKLWVDSLICE